MRGHLTAIQTKAQMTPPSLRLTRAADYADKFLKITAATAIFGGAGAFTFLSDALRDSVQSYFGIHAIVTRIESIEARLPGQKVAIYDASFSYIDGPCVIGAVCIARFKIRRTLYGADCKQPRVTPYVDNHGGIKHPAEYIGGGLRVGSDLWSQIEIRFRVPANARPGRAAYTSLQEYNCPNGTVLEESISLSFMLKASA